MNQIALLTHPASALIRDGGEVGNHPFPGEAVNARIVTTSLDPGFCPSSQMAAEGPLTNHLVFALHKRPGRILVCRACDRRRALRGLLWPIVRYHQRNG